MIAWERHADATREDADGLYRRLSVPVRFADGAIAPYGFGLGRGTEFGRQVTGHGGALRGWRSHRMYVPAERISVVVMFNHLSDAHGAAVDALGAVLGEAPGKPDPQLPAPSWTGAYMEPETGLAVRIDAASVGQVRLRFGHSAELLDLRADGTASSARGTRLRHDGDALWMDRPHENHTSQLQALPGAPASSTAGRYRCTELDAELTVVESGGAVYGAFSGFLGLGRMELLDRVGTDVWALPCPRALDHTPPGDWTIAFRRDDAGRVVAADIGCWLARRLPYIRVGG
jgi:D-aminopeptidase